MALSVDEIIKTICPDLSGSPSLPAYREMAVEVTSRRFYGPMYNYAVAYLAAHQFTLTGQTNDGSAAAAIREISGGASVASMSEGGLSVSFAQNTGGTADAESLGSTKYGRMLLGLRKSRPTMGINQIGLGGCGL